MENVQTWSRKASAEQSVTKTLEKLAIAYSSVVASPVGEDEKSWSVVVEVDCSAEGAEAIQGMLTDEDGRVRATVRAVGGAPTRPSRERVHPDATPIAEVGDNPKRPGSKTHARFELFRNCPNVGEYVSRSLATGTNRKQALLDVRWAAERGQIVLGEVPADAADAAD